MRVLVTGATGFVGSHSVRALLAAGHRVRLLIRSPEKLARVLPAEAAQLDDVVVGDVTDAAVVDQALRGCEAVLHAAGLVTFAAARAREVLDTNRLGARRVVGGAVREGLQSIVYVSSAGALFAPGRGTIRPEQPVAPARSAYARSKADAERFVRDLQERGHPVRISYPCGVLGPDDPGMSEANHMLYTFYRDLFVVTSAGFQLVDVRDLASLHARLVALDGGPGRYLAGAENLSWRELADRLDALTQAPLRRLSVPGGMLRAAGKVGDVIKRMVDFNFPLTAESMEFATRWPGADASRTREELGLDFRPAEETLADTLRWMVRAGHLPAEKIGRLAHC